MPAEVFHVPASPTRSEVFARVSRLFAKLPADKAYRVEVKEHKPKRSDSQNRYLWGVVYATILREGALQGWDADDVHEYMLGEWSGWEVFEGFGRKRMRPIRRSSTLNKQDFSDFVEFIKRRMAEHGVVIPDAGGFDG